MNRCTCACAFHMHTQSKPLITTLDLFKGYWQVPLTESSKELITFRVPNGLYRARTMLFGLHGAPATFQRLVDAVLRRAEHHAATYIDNIVVFSESWKHHITQLPDVLQRIQAAALVHQSTQMPHCQD